MASTVTITVTDLRTVYTSAKNDSALQPFVDIGNMVVNEQVIGTKCGMQMSNDRAKKLAIYVSAHFADISASADAGESGPIKTDKIGESSTTYAVADQNNAGYNQTRWGQLAIALDTCNILLSAPKLKAQFEVVGDNHIGDGKQYG